MALKHETKRRLIHGGNAVVITIIVIAILAGVNFLGTRYTKRFDFTENNLFSVSEQSKQILDNLVAQVQIKAFIPDTFRSYEEGKNAEFIKDLLAEYDVLSSNISVEYINPNKEPQRAKEAGIMYAPAVLIEVEGVSDVLYANNSNEQGLTAAIVKLTRVEENKIGFISGKAGHQVDTDLTLVRQLLEGEGYTVEGVDLRTVASVTDYDAIIVSGPKDFFSTSEIFMLDKYIYEGGKVLFAVDPLFVTGLETLLDSYGIDATDNFVIEEQNYYWDLFRGKFYHWPIIKEFADMQIVRNFSAVMMPLARAIFIKSDIASDIVVEEILKTSASSWIETDTTAESASFTEGEDKRGPLVLGLTMIGKFKSFFEGQDLSSLILEDESEISAEVDDMQPVDEMALERGENLEARVVVYGDSDFMTDQQIRNNNNADLIMNTINWLVEDEDLISIRPKEADDRRIDSMSENVQTFIFWANLLGVSFLVVLAGVIRYFLVKRSRNRL
jgi:ABC-type uncharacterized transport system involved in gliding motility auxiliary subunit